MSKHIFDKTEIGMYCIGSSSQNIKQASRVCGPVCLLITQKVFYSKEVGIVVKSNYLSQYIHFLYI